MAVHAGSLQRCLTLEGGETMEGPGGSDVGRGIYPRTPAGPSMPEAPARCTCSDAASAFSVNVNPAPGHWREESSPGTSMGRRLTGPGCPWLQQKQDLRDPL